MRSTIVATVLALATLISVPAFAAPTPSAPAKTERAGDDKGDKHGKHFPMPAAEFKAKVDSRMAKARKHMEEKAASLPADQAKELRARFEAGAQKVNAEVAKAVADGTVTKDEAKAVRSANPHHGKHARHHGKGKGKGNKPAKK